MNIEVLYFEGCPNHLPAIEMLRETLKSLGRQDEIHQVEVHTQSDAQAMAFVGSPSIRINGADIEPWARTAKAFGLSCRTYLDGSHRSGVPSRELLRRAISERPMEVCALPRARRIYKFLFWSCATLVLVALVYPYVARFFY